MGTASTMACIAETLGMVPLGHGSIPAVHADRLRAAEEAGTLAVKLIEAPIRPSEIITAASVENALRVLLALGGSTNALIHLTAIAGRRGVRVDLHRLNELSDTTPVLVDLKPTGEGYMEDFHAAGGMPALLWELRDLLHLETRDVTGTTLGATVEPTGVRRSPLHSRARRTGLAGGRAGGAVRFAGTTWGDPQAQCRDGRRCSRPRRAPWCSTAWRTLPTASTNRRWT